MEKEKKKSQFFRTVAGKTVLFIAINISFLMTFLCVTAAAVCVQEDLYTKTEAQYLLERSQSQIDYSVMSDAEQLLGSGRFTDTSISIQLVIELGSYTDEEKLMIAKNHLIPKQLSKHGLKKAQLRITDDAIREMITCYTRESGVRKLERQFAQLCRKVDMELLQNADTKRISITGNNLEQYLGTRRFLPDRLPMGDQVGLVTGLAWTSVGGEVLEVEVNVMEGTGKLELTGNLGDVMKESAHAALSYIRANASVLGVPVDFYKTKDIHVHFPEGAVPKDGPSAGITVTTAMVSALTGTPVRRDVAMTGEVSLRGRVMRIGGLKEKTMAALRHGISTVIIPEDNLRDLEEIDQTVRKSLNFVTARTVDTVLDTALVRPVEAVAPVLKDLPTDIKKTHKPSIRQ